MRLPLRPNQIPAALRRRPLSTPSDRRPRPRMPLDHLPHRPPARHGAVTSTHGGGSAAVEDPTIPARPATRSCPTRHATAPQPERISTRAIRFDGGSDDHPPISAGSGPPKFASVTVSGPRPPPRPHRTGPTSGLGTGYRWRPSARDGAGPVAPGGDPAGRGFPRPRGRRPGDGSRPRGSREPGHGRQSAAQRPPGPWGHVGSSTADSNRMSSPHSAVHAPPPVLSFCRTAAPPLMADRGPVKTTRTHTRSARGPFSAADAGDRVDGAREQAARWSTPGRR